jgi:hypothetical protein
MVFNASFTLLVGAAFAAFRVVLESFLAADELVSLEVSPEMFFAALQNVFTFEEVLAGADALASVTMTASTPAATTQTTNTRSVRI